MEFDGICSVTLKAEHMLCWQITSVVEHMNDEMIMLSPWEPQSVIRVISVIIDRQMVMTI